ncbi:MAG: hypothetical protein AVDCRST_MAG68-3212 [uncultured Gemmatimonadetes bacterium]|uniref:SMP-30/Gluconolactonase/LRE-like region domain-containing protein n=1 Tax=uncultured Gemmatimonadota bacterium TaxID=203437 RepID=A0A6J4LXJ3_9BACT|nr:MAG: hypothetical protein AVDCRST_MAG68-3212 [uncultured Gemmatimonadota bacterium]
MNRNSLLRRMALVAATALLAACEGDSTGGERPFILDADGEIGLVVNSTGKYLTLFHTDRPTETRQIPFGASSSVTPTGISVRGRYASVPLGNAGSVALVDLEALRITRFFLFPGGNATGSAFADDTTLLAANFQADYVGRVTVGQAGDSIRQRVDVAPAPTEIVMAAGRAAVISSNLDDKFQRIGNGVVTFLDPRTLQVQGVVRTGDTNPTNAAVGPDNLLYVVNTRDYTADGSVTIINPQTMTVVATVPGFGPGASGIHIDDAGLAYVSSFSTGTVVWNTRTRTFVRGVDNPLCARLASGACRGAFDVATDVQGNVYQAFFGSKSQGLASNVFVYRAGTFALTDSIGAVNGPTAIEVRSF